MCAIPALAPAQTPLTGHYPPGQSGIRGASTPEPGLVDTDFSRLFSNLQVIDAQGDEAQSLDEVRYANISMFAWTTNFEVLGMRYGAALGIPPVIARLLCQRGLSDLDEARAFLEPCIAQLHDPFLLQDMREATRRILQAIAQQEAIAIHGDYDVDGVTSTAILRRAIELLGGTVHHLDRADPGVDDVAQRRFRALVRHAAIAVGDRAELHAVDEGIRPRLGEGRSAQQRRGRDAGDHVDRRSPGPAAPTRTGHRRCTSAECRSRARLPGPPASSGSSGAP